MKVELVEEELLLLKNALFYLKEEGYDGFEDAFLAVGSIPTDITDIEALYPKIEEYHRRSK